MAVIPFEVVSQHRCFNGTVGFYKHEAASTSCSMKFSVFTPPQAQSGRVPVLYYLAGLTCTEETFMIKAGAQRIAAELGIMLVAPDTSPRGLKLPGESDSWDFGVGAGFYVDATVEPWSRHYRMYTYVTQELRARLDHERLFRAGQSGEVIQHRNTSRLRLRRRKDRELHGACGAGRLMLVKAHCPVEATVLTDDFERDDCHDASPILLPGAAILASSSAGAGPTMRR